MGIECDGFGADTLHMARLLDASRRGKKTYGLDNLTMDWDVSPVVLAVNLFHFTVPFPEYLMALNRGSPTILMTDHAAHCTCHSAPPEARLGLQIKE